jgi:hypothetical protein
VEGHGGCNRQVSSVAICCEWRHRYKSIYVTVKERYNSWDVL